MKVKNRKPQRQFEQWARRAMKGVKESASFLQLYTPNWDPAPIVILAPEGTVVPPKLRAVADSVQFYLPEDPRSCELAARRALEAIGVVKH